MISNQKQTMERLAGAKLFQTTMDILTGSRSTAASAIVWVRQRGDDRLSFQYCCRLLNRDPDAVRVGLERRHRERQPDCVFPVWSERATPASQALAAGLLASG